MSGATYRNQPAEHRDHSARRRVRHRVVVWLLVPLLLAAAIFAVLDVRIQGSGVTSKATSFGVHESTSLMQPADRFIQSIVTEDGALGWHQLCPSIQAQLPLDALVQQADAMRTAAAREGAWLTAEPMGTHSQPGGGKLHVYRLTMHWPKGATQQRTYTVLTQLSGCVEDVQVQ